jgi:hypothetical protein
LPLAAVLVLGLGVYLLVEVRAQPAPPATRVAPRDRAVAPAASVPQVAAPGPQAQVIETPPSPDRMASRPADTARRASPPALEAAPTADLVGPALDAAMADANSAYDRGDFEDARTLASRVLARHPTNVRMLRIMVSAACIEGDQAAAQTHYTALPADDQGQMKIRCARYGISFPDTPAR